MYFLVFPTFFGVRYKNVHESDWVELMRFFDSTHYGELKKIQPNPTHMGRVEPKSLTIFFISIIIKLSRKNKNKNIF